MDVIMIRKPILFPYVSQMFKLEDLKIDVWLETSSFLSQKRENESLKLHKVMSNAYTS